LTQRVNQIIITMEQLIINIGLDIVISLLVAFIVFMFTLMVLDLMCPKTRIMDTKVVKLSIWVGIVSFIASFLALLF
jgi:hypothetical protein